MYKHEIEYKIVSVHVPLSFVLINFVFINFLLFLIAEFSKMKDDCLSTKNTKKQSEEKSMETEQNDKKEDDDSGSNTTTEKQKEKSKEPSEAGDTEVCVLSLCTHKPPFLFDAQLCLHCMCLPLNLMESIMLLLIDY